MNITTPTESNLPVYFSIYNRESNRFKRQCESFILSLFTMCDKIELNEYYFN